jgi:hypothetical protein
MWLMPQYFTGQLSKFAMLNEDGNLDRLLLVMCLRPSSFVFF